MIRLTRPSHRRLSQAARNDLAAEHTKAKQFPRGDSGIKRAWKNFRARNAGKEVHRQLATVSHGKCYFCERINAETIDHYYPKERYPKWMFHWNNMVLCCWACNHAKGERFLFQNRRPLLLNPATDEPLDYFVWDLQTGAMESVNDPARKLRATTTRTHLRLDEESLRNERANKLKDVVYLLARVINESPIESDTNERLEAALRPERPYLGIIRFLFRTQNQYQPIIDAARAKLPEIDIWVSAWL